MRSVVGREDREAGRSLFVLQTRSGFDRNRVRTLPRQPIKASRACLDSNPPPPPLSLGDRVPVADKEQKGSEVRMDTRTPFVWDLLRESSYLPYKRQENGKYHWRLVCGGRGGPGARGHRGQQDPEERRWGGGRARGRGRGREGRGGPTAHRPGDDREGHWGGRTWVWIPGDQIRNLNHHPYHSVLRAFALSLTLLLSFSTSSSHILCLKERNQEKWQNNEREDKCDKGTMIQVRIYCGVNWDCGSAYGEVRRPSNDFDFFAGTVCAGSGGAYAEEGARVGARLLSSAARAPVVGWPGRVAVPHGSLCGAQEQTLELHKEHIQGFIETIWSMKMKIIFFLATKNIW